MSTFPVYDNTHEALAQMLPTVRASQRDTLALLVASATRNVRQYNVR